MKRGLGHLPDPPNAGKGHVHELFAARNIAGPTTAAQSDMRDVWIVRDQSITSSCVGFALSAALMAHAARAGRPLPTLSPFSIYDWARKLSAPAMPFRDQGCQPTYACDGIRKWGVALESVRPFDEGAVNAEPSVLEAESAEGLKFSGHYRIEGDQAMRTQAITTALAANVPVTAALMADVAFEQYQNGLYTPGGSPKGGHYIGICGHITQGDGSVAFICGNSWSSFWGANGFFLAHESVVATWTDCYALDVEVE